MSVRFTHNVLVPGWILIFGLAALYGPPLGAALSLSLFMVGIFGIPALLVIPRAVGLRARAITTRPLVGRLRRSRWRFYDSSHP